ncbi:MAG: hypothetical protein PHT44_00100 [Candidatus Portnoybacteria bacterium]|nr:hypothetical protein [Candidatus Portnoybacteria bacterium]MDD4982978.1 hypothetical protein [Candidatus Portnoybacteria bacterium]
MNLINSYREHLDQKLSKRDKTFLKYFALAVLIVLFLYFWFVSIPAILIWYIWKRVSWDKRKKWIAIASILVLFSILYGFNKYSQRAPEVAILEPQNGVAIQADHVLVRGKVSPSRSILEINGKPENADNGQFSYNFSLTDEKNSLSVRAKNGGKTIETVLAITRIFTEEEKAERARLQAEVEAKKQAEREARLKEQERIRKESAAILAKLRKEYDDVRQIAFYYDASTPIPNNVNNVSLYIAKSDGGASILRFRIRYAGEDWLFIKKYSFKVDEKVFDFYPNDKIERDNTNTVWEWYDGVANDEALQIIAAIIGSKEAKIRYEGQQYYKDRVITVAEKTALSNVLKAYSLLSN